VTTLELPVVPTKISDGQVMPVQVMTVTVNEQLAVLAAASVAVQLTVVVPSGKLEPEAGTQAVVTPGQLSVAVGAG
jgi:hypothetical protein